MIHERPDNDALLATSREARERYARACDLFDTARDLHGREREVLLDDATRTDPAVAADVRSLLRANALLAGFLERSADDPTRAPLQEALSHRYVLLERIAVGGMASVYRADDLRHGRNVAIKVVVTEALAADHTHALPQRFRDEIQVTAGLQHANIMPLFDSGASPGLLYYVMPFVDGETLRQLLRRSGPLALDEAIRISRGIALALTHAHAAGVVHRDLKPENILLRDGEPLVCDFGIALTTAPHDAARHTQTGTLIGTPLYMSPEQASGARVIDLRSDIYSLAAMLYEMLVGDPPHMASTPQGVLAKVRAEPPTSVARLRASVPIGVSLALDGALSKLPVDRFPSAQAFMDALDAGRTPAPYTSNRLSDSWMRWVRVAAGIAAISVVATATLLARRTTGASATPPAIATRFVVTPIADAAVGRAPTITPDGSAIVYAGSAASGRQLFVRPVDQLDARALPHTHGALNTWVSPNGKRIAYMSTDDRINIVGVDGRGGRSVASAFRYSDATWLNDSVLVFGSFGQEGLSWISASGGRSHQLTQLDTLRHDTVHQTPIALGDGTGIIFVATQNRSGPAMNVGDLSLVRFAPGSIRAAKYIPLGVMASQAFAYFEGWLLYVSVDGHAMLAVRLDPRTGAVTGAPIPVLEQEGGGIERVTLAGNGTLLYSRRVQPKNTPVLVDSTGAATPILKGLSGSFMNPRVSPDGRQIVVQGLSAAGNDAWLYDLATGTQTRLTTSGMVVGPAWMADGRRVVYVSSRDGQDALWTNAVDGTGAAVRVASASGAFAASPSSVGDVLLFQRRTNSGWSIWQAPATPAEQPQPIVQGDYDAFMPSLSPDGRLLAYASSESGRYEIYVRPFPFSGAALQVSTDGGTEPLWSRDGARIFYRGEGKMMFATIAPGSPPTVTQRRALFADRFDGDMPMPHRNYDITPDGHRFVMIAPTDDVTPQTIVVLNWTTELRARIAAARR